MKNRLLILLAIVAAILAAIVLTRADAPVVKPNPPASFSFAALGDAPYYPWEELQFRLVLRSIDAHDLAAVLHVGDIFWRPCSDRMYERALARFNRLRHPVVYTPGDNEWCDCWEPGSGGYVPNERLKRIRQIFFSNPRRSLGEKRIALASQEGEFVEHARWSYRGVVFATVNLPGTGNASELPHPDAAEIRRRTEAAAAWMRETFAAARASGAAAVVVAFHANPGFAEPPGDRYRRNYEPFLVALEEENERFAKPVLVVQGDDHAFVVDHPFVRRTTGRRLDNMTRLQVPGSPKVGWVRVVVTPEAASPFAFEKYVVPRWKYWGF